MARAWVMILGRASDVGRGRGPKGGLQGPAGGGRAQRGQGSWLAGLGHGQGVSELVCGTASKEAAFRVQLLGIATQKLEGTEGRARRAPGGRLCLPVERRTGILDQKRPCCDTGMLSTSQGELPGGVALSCGIGLLQAGWLLLLLCTRPGAAEGRAGRREETARFPWQTSHFGGGEGEQARGHMVEAG